MHRFDYTFLKTESIPPKLINVVSSIYSLKSMSQFQKGENAKVFTELESIAKIQSVKGSNAIEGIITSDDRIKAIVQEKVSPINHDEAEIAGYRDALNQIHQNYQYISFMESDILSLYSVLLSFSDYEQKGKYKDIDNAIIEIDENGKRRMRLNPVSAKDTPFFMEQLILSYTEAQSDSKINGLLLIPCVILDFLCIHPFRDGNGRMSRLLSLLLLYKNGFDVGKYISFEEQINKYKNQYYDALYVSSFGWHENTNDYFPFIENFLTFLFLCYKELDKRFAIVNGKKVSKTARVESTILNAITPLSKNEIHDILPEVSITTIELVLGKMLKMGKIVKIGSARSTRYYKNNNKHTN